MARGINGHDLADSARHRSGNTRQRRYCPDLPLGDRRKTARTGHYRACTTPACSDETGWSNTVWSTFGVVEAAPAYSVRTAEPGDLLDIVRLIDRVPRLEPSELTLTQRTTWERMLGTPNLTIYVAVAPPEVVGTTSLFVMPHVTYGCQPSAFIEPMVVGEPHRRRGVGRMMLQRVLDDARQTGCRKVQIVSHKRHAQDGAHDFYRSLGFSAEAEGFRLYL